jgi:TonB family protein
MIPMKTRLAFISAILIMIIAAPALFSQNTVYDDPQNMNVVVNQEAHYPAGEMAVVQYVYQNVKWPEATKGKVVEGEVMLSFNVQPDSTLTDFAVMKGVGLGVDEEIVRVMKKLKYAPSIQNGTKVEMNLIFTIQIRYRGN